MESRVMWICRFSMIVFKSHYSNGQQNTSQCGFCVEKGTDSFNGFRLGFCKFYLNLVIWIAVDQVADESIIVLQQNKNSER